MLETVKIVDTYGDKLMVMADVDRVPTVGGTAVESGDCPDALLMSVDLDFGSVSNAECGLDRPGTFGLEIDPSDKEVGRSRYVGRVVILGYDETHMADMGMMYLVRLLGGLSGIGWETATMFGLAKDGMEMALRFRADSNLCIPGCGTIDRGVNWTWAFDDMAVFNEASLSVKARFITNRFGGLFSGEPGKYTEDIVDGSAAPFCTTYGTECTPPAHLVKSVVKSVVKKSGSKKVKSKRTKGK